MKIETIASGYRLPEGFCLDNVGNLYFSDALGGGVFKLPPGGPVEVVDRHRRLVGGMILHRSGGIVMTGSNVALWKDNSTRTLLELDDVHYFNDLTADSEGAVYVAAIRSDIEKLMEEAAANHDMGDDGTYIRNRLTPGACYKISKDGSVKQLYGDVLVGNGMAFAQDGQRLYHVDSYAQGIIVHDLDTDGELINRRLIGEMSFTEGVPDGMTMGADGSLWVAHFGGGRVVNLSADGRELGEIPIPGKGVTSVAFGGSDLSDMYVGSGDNSEDPQLGGCIFKITDTGYTGSIAPSAAV